MRQKKRSTTLLQSGIVVCCECLSSSDQVDRAIEEGGTYGSDKCDRCGASPQTAPVTADCES